MSAADVSMAKRLETEREFHNNRFKGGDNRQAQLKYYWAVARGAELYALKVKELAKDADVLEYGCGALPHSLHLIKSARSIDAIDISDEAIKTAALENSAPNLRLSVMDAMNMSFPDESFDLVFGSGIVHHLDTALSAREIARVLRKGGRAVFWEPLGLNPIINTYRYLTPSARTPDEHPFLPRDIQIFRENFASVEVSFFGLTTLAAVPFRAAHTGEIARKILERVDSAILSVPGVRHLAWYCLIDCTR
jgi:SAM-dependent methyltransferase